ncbi:MAG: hypothetical protein AAFQ82_05965, partial [Myxococcota bacterium]
MTLIELGMVFAIAVVILSVAAPRLSSVLDTSKQQATVNELIELQKLAGPIVERLGYPTTVGGAPGTIIPRTALTPVGRSSLPAEAQDLFPPYFDGVNPFTGNNPYFLTIQKQNLGGAVPFAHDMYISTVETCIPDHLGGLTELRSGITVAAVGCPAGELRASYQSVVTFSSRARELRALRRYYCCGDRDYTNTVTGAGG